MVRLCTLSNMLQMAMWNMTTKLTWYRIYELLAIRYTSVTPTYVFNSILLFQGRNQKVETKPVYIPQQRIVHLDLKGAPPSIQYIRKVLTMSKTLGATGVLVEWEDMFPWSGR
jgi:hypothetical protein